LIYAFADGIGKFINHLINGYTILNDIPESEFEKETDSNVIHYVRLSILGLMILLI
jgi:hypothetical protein